MGKLEIVIIYVFTASLVAGLFVTQDECPPNEEYLLCGSACPFNCSNPEGPVQCTEDCIEGCFCKNGFLRGDNGTCVTEEQCIGTNASICSDNEEFLSCGTACPLTCSQPDTPADCGVACSVGCFCKAGYVRDEENNKCVTIDQCPVEQCFGPSEVYDICNAGCEPSCQDPEPICTKLCTGGCICAPGLLRDDNGLCVSVDNCPTNNATDPGLLAKYLNVVNKILHITNAEGANA